MVFQALRGEFREKLACDGEYLLLDPMTKRFVQVCNAGLKGFESFTSLRLGYCTSFIDEPLVFRLRLCCSLIEECATLLLKFPVAVFKAIALLLCFGLYRGGVSQLGGDFFSRAAIAPIIGR